MDTDERNLVRDLARQYIEFAESDENKKRMGLWSNHNSLKYTRPLIRVMQFAEHEISEINNLQCTEPYMRNLEYFFRKEIYKISLNDDTIFKPWYSVRACFEYPTTYDLRWGAKISVIRPEMSGGAFIHDPPIKTEEDLNKLIKPYHSIDEQKSKEKHEQISEILDGIIPVITDRTPNYYISNITDISTDLGYLLGLGQMMWHMMDNPELVKNTAEFMSNGVLSVQDTAEKAGDLTTAVQWNQSMTYANELPEPSADGIPVLRYDLWTGCAAQEAAGISPAMWEEFIFNYQKPIISKFGLVSYGCCEDLTRFIPILKRDLKNLRRISVTPWANTRSCAEQIGSDYVMSWRPSPTDMVINYKPERVKAIIREVFKIAAEHRNIIDITLKDVETISGNLDAVPGFVKCAREVIDEGCWLFQ